MLAYVHWVRFPIFFVYQNDLGGGFKTWGEGFSAGLPNSHKNSFLPKIRPIKAVIFRFPQLLVSSALQLALPRGAARGSRKHRNRRLGCESL